MKKYEKLIQLILSGFLWLIFMPLHAQEQNVSFTPKQLTEQATLWLQQHITQHSKSHFEIQASQLDERIGLKYCQQTLEFSLSSPITQRQNTIQIRCNSLASWQLYLPVRIEEMVQTVVITQNVGAGSLITEQMLTVEKRERRALRGSLVTDKAQIIGAKTKRTIALGQIITLQDLCLVCKGDVVTITINNNGLSVSATGIAQHDGTLGDTINVVNRQSQRAVSAQVIAVNQVSVKL